MIPRMGLFALAALAIGCGPTFHAVTAPPATRTAALDAEAETIEISPGVALAFECLPHISTAECEAASPSVDDPRIANVLPAYLAQVDEHWWMRNGPQPRVSFVVWGVAPGKTKLRLRSKDGESVLDVRVVADAAEPAPPKLLQASSR